MTLFYIILTTFLGTLLALGIAGLFLLFREPIRETLIPILIAFATGSLLGATFLGLLPHSLETLSPQVALAVVLLGILGFFILEKFVIWRHCHEDECETHGTAAPLILFGDGLHNFIDGILIAAAFMTSHQLGFAAAIAVIMHEIPQEVGDFAILLKSGYSRKKALLANVASGMAALLGGLIGYFFLMQVTFLLPYMMTLAAASFLYVAVADLVPTLHKFTSASHSIRQIVFIAAGIGIVYLLEMH